MKPASLRYLPLFIILNTIGPALAAKAETLPKFRTVAEPIPGEYIVVFDEHPAIQLGITRAPRMLLPPLTEERFIFITMPRSRDSASGFPKKRRERSARARM